MGSTLHYVSYVLDGPSNKLPLKKLLCLHNYYEGFFSASSYVSDARARTAEAWVADVPHFLLIWVAVKGLSWESW